MISVIVRVYNGRFTLDACLQAIFRSADCPKFEVILVDDGSADSSPEIAEKYPFNARFHGFLLKKKGPWFAGRAGGLGRP